MKMKLSEIRQLINAQIKSSLLEFKSSDMPAGTAWKVGASGWAAKNKNGVTNYWYGGNEEKNKSAANTFRNDTERRLDSK